MRRGLVASLRFFQGRGILAVHRVQAAADEPLLVVGRIIRPRSAQDEQLDLVRAVANVFQRADAERGLRVRLELELPRAQRARLVGDVRLGHPGIVGAKDALARAGKGLGHHRDRSDARNGAYWLGAQAG